MLPGMYPRRVTLILGASKPEGIYMSVDYRVTDARTGRVIDNATPKCLTVTYPPHPGGTRALFAFTGLAVLPDGTPMLKWLRETLRGESELPDRSLMHLRERLNRDLAPLRQPLIVNVLALHRADGRRFVGGFSNLSRSEAKPLNEFGYVMHEIDDSFMFANGAAALIAVADQNFRKAKALLGVRPRHPKEFMKLLSIVNRRTAARDAGVSAFCNAHFVNADDRFPPSSQSFLQRGETVPFEMPMLLFGIDLTDFTKQFMEAAQRSSSTGEPMPPIDPDEMNRRLRRRP